MSAGHAEQPAQALEALRQICSSGKSETRRRQTQGERLHFSHQKRLAGRLRERHQLKLKSSPPTSQTHRARSCTFGADCPGRGFDGLGITVLSIGKLAAGQATYYLEQARRRVDVVASVGTGVEDYYFDGPEAEGEWLGAGAELLGLAGAVSEASLRRVLAGLDPSRDDRLLSAASAVRVPGFDVTFSAPKSVSVLFGIGNESLRRQISAAHGAALTDGFAYLERNAAIGRRGRGGAVSVRGDGFVAAAFTHRVSRAGDPQLHTHVLVANLTRGPDGRWTAIDARELFTHAKTAGYLYEARLRAELTRRLGVEWEVPRRGIAELVWVSPEVRRSFSRRRAEIVAELERRGESGSSAARIATLATRRRKDRSISPSALVHEWRHRAAALGLDQAAIRSLVGRQQSRPLLIAERAAMLAFLASPAGMTAERSSFARRDVLRAIATLVEPGADVSGEWLEGAADDFLASPRVVAIDNPGGRGRERRYTTPELLQIEQRVIARVLDGQGQRARVVPEDRVERALRARPYLSPEQRAMVRRLTLGGDAVAVVAGKAGAGKTSALDAAREAWEQAGVEVLGAAVARRAAHELESGAGILSTSVAAIVAALRQGSWRPPAGAVLVVDEAGMLPTRDLVELIDSVGQANGKLVLVGDHRQLPEVGAGGAFRALVWRGLAVELHENRRQATAVERRAVDDLRAGRAERAVSVKREHHTLVLADDAGALRRQLVRDWWESRDVDGAVMLALRRADVADLNARARALMRESGALGSETLQLAAGEVSSGDRVLLRKNSRRLHVANGERGRVLAVDPSARSMTIDLGGRTVRLDRAYLDGRTQRGDPTVLHGYAMTGHLAQGLTVRRAFVLGTDAVYREWGYTALSRGREENRLYAVAPRDRERDEIAPRPGERTHPLVDLTGRLQRSRAELMAHDVALAGDLEQLPDGALRAERDQLSVLVDNAPYRRFERQLDAIERAREGLQSPYGNDSRTRSPLAERRLAVLGQREAELRARANAERGRWLGVHAEQVMRYALVREELGRRASARARAAALDPPPAVVGALGERPEAPDALAAWTGAARAMEAFEAVHGTSRRLDASERAAQRNIERLVSAARARQAPQPAVAIPRTQRDPRRREVPVHEDGRVVAALPDDGRRRERSVRR
jgi:conjugative relaxase-like TrwC/TraI family protein